MRGYQQHQVEREGVDLTVYVQDGDGPIMFFQHGLCGSAGQPADVFPQRVGHRHAVLECRGHGGSALGPVDDLSIATFADDLAAAIETYAEAPCLIGGISMGAVIAQRLVVLRPGLVKGLVLARPAWVCEPGPENMRPNLKVGTVLLNDETPVERDLFLASKTAKRLAAEAPDNLTSLVGFFDRKPRRDTAELLTRISKDGPGVCQEDLRGISIPTMVIGHGEDLVHPLSYATELAELIPSASLCSIPSKTTDRDGYTAQFRAALTEFLGGASHE